MSAKSSHTKPTSREEEEMGREAHYEQFAPDLTSEPSLLMTEAELKEIADKLDDDMHKPIDWDKHDGLL